MEGFTTFPLRLWIYLASQPTHMTTPFLRVTRTFPEHDIPADFAPELYQLRGAFPYQLIPQLITGDPEQFLRTAALLPPAITSAIEINCGCPSPNSLGKSAGSGMLRDAAIFGETIARLQAELGADRLAVKMRLGIDRPDEFPALLQAIAPLPLARLTVHGRTRADGYRGHADWAAIQTAAAAARAPVLASGDVWGQATLLQLYQEAPDIHGAMIGRGALRNPWVFAELREQKPTGMHLHTLINALFCYALIQELWQREAGKLIARISKGRIGEPCYGVFESWEKLTVELTSLIYGLPFLLLKSSSLTAVSSPASLSSVAFSRLRLLWSYFRSSLPDAFADARLLRSKSAGEFFERLFIVGEPWDRAEALIEIGHRPEWDAHFAGARG